MKSSKLSLTPGTITSDITGILQTIYYWFCSAHHKVLERILPFENKRINNKIMAQKVEISLKWTLVNETTLFLDQVVIYRSLCGSLHSSSACCREPGTLCTAAVMKPIACKTSPSKVVEKDPCHCQEGLFPIPCQRDYNWHSSGSHPSAPTKQEDSRTGQEPSQSLTKTLHHSDTSQHKAWELGSAVQCKNTAFPIRKHCSPFFLTGRTSKFCKTDYFFSSSCVGIVTDVMTHNQLFSI